MSIPRQAVLHAAKKLYEREAKTSSLPSPVPWEKAHPTTRLSYETRASVIIEAYQEWLRTGPGGGG